MASKKILLLILAVLAEVRICIPNYCFNNSQLHFFFQQYACKSIQDDLKQQLNELYDQINASSIEGYEILDKEMQSMHNYGAALMLKNEDILYQASGIGLQDIRSIVDLADNEGVNVDDCNYKVVEGQLPQMSSNTAKHARFCEGDQYTVGSTVASNALGKLKAFHDAADNIGVEISKCNDDDCSKKIKQEIDDVKSLTENQRKEISTVVVQEIRDVRKNLNKCMIDFVKQTVLVITELSVDTLQCVIDKLAGYV